MLADKTERVATIHRLHRSEERGVCFRVSYDVSVSPVNIIRAEKIIF